MKSDYNLRLHGDNRIILNLRYETGVGTVDLEGCGAFFQVGETKPVPGEISGSSIMFDFKPDLKQTLDGQGFGVFVKDFKTQKTVDILHGTLRTESG